VRNEREELSCIYGRRTATEIRVNDNYVKIESCSIVFRTENDELNGSNLFVLRSRAEFGPRPVARAFVREYI